MRYLPRELNPATGQKDRGLKLQNSPKYCLAYMLDFILICKWARLTVKRAIAIFSSIFFFDRRSSDPICYSFLTWFGHDFTAGQFVSDRSFLIAATAGYCMWHWPIGKDLDLSFIRGHHLHLVGRPADYFTLASPYWRDHTQQGRNSCPRLQFLAFSLDSIMSLPR